MSKKGEGNARAVSTRLGSVSAQKLAGQIKHDLRQGKQPNYVDEKRRDQNRVLIEPVRVAEMRKIAESRRAKREVKAQRAMKRNAAIATRGIITFGSEAAAIFDKLTNDQQDAAFREVAEAIAARLGTTLHGLVVHCDETTIHAHYQLSSYNVYGLPLSQTTSPSVLQDLQTITAEIVGRHAPGIERGYSYGDRISAGADYADTLHRSVKQLHRDLPAELAAAQSRVETAKADEVEQSERIEKNRRLIEKAEAKIAKLQDHEVEQTAKISRNIEIYQKRVADAETRLTETQQQHIDAQRDIDRMMRTAAAEIDTAKKTVENDRAALVLEKEEHLKKVEQDDAKLKADVHEAKRMIADKKEKNEAELKSKIDSVKTSFDIQKRKDTARLANIVEREKEIISFVNEKSGIINGLINSVREVLPSIRAKITSLITKKDTSKDLDVAKTLRKETISTLSTLRAEHADLSATRDIFAARRQMQETPEPEAPEPEKRADYSPSP